MDPAQVVFYAGWIFFAGWGAVLAAAGVIAFGPDIEASADQKTQQDRAPTSMAND